MIDESDGFEDDEEYEPGTWLNDPESWLNDQIVDNEPDPDDYYYELRERRDDRKYDGGKDDGGKYNVVSTRRTEK